MSMHQITAVALTALTLTGCASTATDSVATPHVMVIQKPCPTAADEHRPPPPPARLRDLNPNSPGAVAKAVALALTEHRARADALEKLLDACK